jgi:excinuclease ABC subunit A
MIVDLGPEGGDQGGYIIATGTPEELTEFESSQTGRYLSVSLGERRPSAMQKTA